jgi:hypothetical protein
VPSDEKENTNPWFERHALEYQVQSQNTTHFELVFILGDEQPFPKNITAIEKYELGGRQDDYIIRSLDYSPNTNWDFNLTRYFEIMADGILICHSTAHHNLYDDEVCNLEAEVNIGDTLIFSNEGFKYHSQFERFITPNIVQLLDRKLVSDFPKDPSAESFHEDDEGFGDEAPAEEEPAKGELDFIKITSAIVQPVFYIVDSRNGKIQWRPAFDPVLSKTKPQLSIKGE